MSWFSDIFGFEEGSPDEVRRQVRVEGEELLCLSSGRRLGIGRLLTQSILNALTKP